MNHEEIQKSLQMKYLILKPLNKEVIELKEKIEQLEKDKEYLEKEIEELKNKRDETLDKIVRMTSKEMDALSRFNW